MPNRKSSGGGGARIGCIAFLLTAVACVATWYFMYKPTPEDFQEFANYDFSDFSNVLGTFNYSDFDQGIEIDPFMASNGTDIWNTGGANNGLSLSVINALDVHWFDLFNTVISEWDSGTPDALDLDVHMGEVDNACTPVKGKMKVCNGNYGETGWLGLNDLLTNKRTGFIRSSVAKMNEFYLHNADQYSRQYTMCHEIGHGFGLLHTDESFTNRDLGNCMDYTRSPKNNLHPDKSNFRELKQMYGAIGDSSQRQRRRRTKSQRNERAMQKSNPSRAVLREYENARKEMEFDFRRIDHELRRSSSADASVSGWRRLSKQASSSSGGDRGGARFTRYLGEGYNLVVHVLYAH